MINVRDFSGLHTVETQPDILKIMSARFGDEGVNEILLTHDGHDYPFLAIELKDDLAALYYVPADGDAGFASVGGKLGLDARGATVFKTGSMSTNTSISNEAIVTFREALAAAVEFLHSEALPNSIKWLRL
jgi:hypothetical protein